MDKYKNKIFGGFEMKNMKKWLPILLIALVTMFLTGCKVDWTTVSATETNIFAFGAFWALVHIIVPVILFIAAIALISPDSYDIDAEGSAAARGILGTVLIGLYVFHFFFIKADWFNLSCLTQLGLFALAFVIFNMALYDDTDAESITYSLVSTGIAVVSLLANAFTGKYLEPFVFSCAGWFAIISGSIARKVRDDNEIGAEILSPVLCLAAMIFAITHVSAPNFLYMIAIQCAIATVFTLPFIGLEDQETTSFIVLLFNYVWVFVTAIHYNAENFKSSLMFSFIGWGALLLLFIIAFIISAKKAAKEAAALAAYNAQKAKERAAEKQRQQELAAKKKAEEEATAKIIAEEKAKMKAEAEAKAKQEAEEKAKAEAEAKAKQLAETQRVLTQMENDLAAKKAQVASLGLDAQGIVQKAKLNKEIKDLEPQIETLKAEVERLSK